MKGLFIPGITAEMFRSGCHCQSLTGEVMPNENEQEGLCKVVSKTHALSRRRSLSRKTASVPLRIWKSRKARKADG